MNKYGALAAIVCFFFSCQSPHSKMAKLWLYTHYSGQDNPRYLHFSPASFLLLQPDGSFAKDLGRFETGRWKLVKDTLTLVNTDHEVSRYPASCDGHDLRLITVQNERINFESAPVNLESDLENPFSANNNQWRIKATHKESTEELKKRLRNHLQYWVAYFTWAYKNDFNTVDVRSAPSPIKIYANGLAVKPTSELTTNWIHLFYDEQDCISLSKLLEKQVKSNPITWSHTDNRYKMFIGAFQQLRDDLQ